MSNSRCIRLHRSIFLFSSVLQPSPLFNASQSQSPSLSQGGDCECLHLCNPAYPQIAWRSSIHSLCGRPMVPITSARYRTILNTSEWPNPLKRAIFCILLSSDGLGFRRKTRDSSSRRGGLRYSRHLRKTSCTIEDIRPPSRRSEKAILNKPACTNMGGAG